MVAVGRVPGSPTAGPAQGEREGRAGWPAVLAIIDAMARRDSVRNEHRGGASDALEEMPEA